MKENNILKILIAILIILNLIMCFKGLKLETENRELREKVKELEIDLTTVYLKGVEDGKDKHEQKIKEKIEEYLEFDKKHKTYTKDGRKNFTMEYFKAKALEELLQESEDK